MVPYNTWNEFEYSKLKLLLHNDKVHSILETLNRKKEFDDTLPVSVDLHLTDRCNADCYWCTDKLLRKNAASQSKENLFTLFKLFSKNNIGVTIEGGGEPTIYKHFDEIVEFGSAENLEMGLLTNGIKDVSRLIKYFRWVRVSLDASTKEEFLAAKGVNKFDQVLTNIEKYCKRRNIKKTQIGAAYVLTKNNLGKLIDLVYKLNDIGVDYLYLRPVEENVKNRPSIEVLKMLKQTLDEISLSLRMKYIINISDRFILNNDFLPCVSHSLTCTIHANGNVVPCEKRRHDPAVFGNINEESFEEIWRSRNRAELSSRLLDSKNQLGCQVCRLTSFNKIFFDLNKINTMNFI